MHSKKLKIGIVADCKLQDPHYFHSIGDKYLRAITEGMGATPILIPALGADLLDEYLAMVDGILLTGAYSNVEPHHYGAEKNQSPVHDPQRDATTLPLISKAIDADVPIFGICRGFQEINVVYGGTLHEKVQNLSDMLDHREDSSAEVEQQYSPAHDIALTEGGLLASLVGGLVASVNSVHQQGVKDLGAGLKVEALAPDGLVEAFQSEQHDRFVLAVQWHPEWKVTGNPFYLSLFQAFKQACLDRRAQTQ